MLTSGSGASDLRGTRRRAWNRLWFSEASLVRLAFRIGMMLLALGRPRPPLP